MSFGHSPIVPILLGLILIASSAADGHELATSGPDVSGSLLARVEVAYLGGLWLLSGFWPRSARNAAIGAFGCLLVHDLARAALGAPPRDGFARVAVGPWWVLGSDQIVLLALLRWRPSPVAISPIIPHPGRFIVAAAMALAAGVAIDRSQVGRFPIVARARSGAPRSSPGLEYLVYLPGGYHRWPGRWPLILYLHGAGEVGRGLGRVRASGLPRRIEEGTRLPFIVVAPYCPLHGWEVEALDALLDDVLSQYAVDADRVYLTGLSMGGVGTWALAAAHPGRFAAIAPISGGGDPAWADPLRGLPTWAFHGAEDTVVPPGESREMVEALGRAGGAVRFTTYPGVGHDAWTLTYADPGLYAWFLSHRRVVGGRAVASPTPAR